MSYTRIYLQTDYANIYLYNVISSNTENVDSVVSTPVCRSMGPVPGGLVHLPLDTSRIILGGVYEYSLRNLRWNSLSRPSISMIMDSGGRMVVLKWKVPGLWPKPEPGTTQMPVASSR